jgi:CMP-N,N'-diacetyllegionaminic acid synthase
MISGRKVLAVIPARGQSKGVPRKNLRIVGGKPLIAWTIDAAKRSRYIDRLILSSEDEEIILVATQFGCEAPFVRPVELAQDDTPGIDPVLHAIKETPGYDYVVLLQPTSPLRTIEDIDGCIEHCLNQGAKACVSVSLVEQHPRWMYTLGEKDCLVPLISDGRVYARRQDLPRVFMLNGAVYVSECKWLINYKTFLSNSTIGYVMPQERSLDIDQEIDLKICDELLRNFQSS